MKITSKKPIQNLIALCSLVTHFTILKFKQPPIEQYPAFLDIPKYWLLSYNQKHSKFYKPYLFNL